jgi:urease accessory protein
MEDLTAQRVRPAGERPPAAADSVTLDHEGRQVRRRRLRTDGGRLLFVDLAETVALADGDAFETTEGALVLVRAAREPLVEVRADDARHLARLAWHIGNRHLPVEVQEGRLLILRDHVIEAMLVGLGARVAHVEEPFEPEGGAYGGHGHAHG